MFPLLMPVIFEVFGVLNFRTAWRAWCSRGTGSSWCWCCTSLQQAWDTIALSVLPTFDAIYLDHLLPAGVVSVLPLIVPIVLEIFGILNFRSTWSTGSPWSTRSSWSRGGLEDQGMRIKHKGSNQQQLDTSHSCL